MNKNIAAQKQEEILALARSAEAVKAQREKARRHLYDYHLYMHPNFYETAHIKLISSYLEEVYRYIETEGKEGIGQLMVFVSPQTGKSTITSMDLPSWILGKRPNTKIALTSYVSTLAERNSRKVRDMLEEESYDLLFGRKSIVDAPVELSKDSRSISDWLVGKPHEGGVIARGVGGGITGFSLDLIVIDDPFKDRKEASSEKQREDVWNWYTSAVDSRVRPGTAVILMHTRWDADDLAGRLLKKMAEGDDRWVVLFIPALALNDPNQPETAIDGLDSYAKNAEETMKLMARGMYVPTEDMLGRKPGESVCERMFPADMLRRKRVKIGDNEFSPVYQQLTKSKSGTMFPRDKVNYVKAVPAGTVCVRWWDKAGTKGGDGAKTSGVLIGKTPAGRYIVIDVISGRWELNERERIIKSTAVKDKATYNRVQIWFEQEPGSGGKDSALISIQNLAGFEAYAETMAGQGNKELRAEPFAAQWQAGNVDILVGKWNETFIDELELFPHGLLKDQVDAGGGAFTKVTLLKPRPESRIY